MCSDILHGLSNDVCKALKDQENTLDDVRELFRSFPDLRQHIDTGNFITTSVLQVVEAQSATLDDLARDMAKLDVTITKTAEVLDRVPDLEFKKENRDTLQRIEEKLARVEGQVAAGQFFSIPTCLDIESPKR
jgi:outer membrane protein assembly factor BamD (BamD/ComL family)